MIEKYGLFDSLEGDEREYTENDLALLVKALRGDGVRGESDALLVKAAAAGLAVTVEPGLATVQGRYYALEDDGSGAKQMNLTAASVNPRIDRIVLTLSYAERTVKLGVLMGTEAASPAPPALVRNAERYMLSLAQVRVPVGAAVILAENVTDERADWALCGLYAATAEEAMQAAGAAQQTANEAKNAAAAAQQTANTGVTNAAAALAEAQKKMPKASGVTDGHLPVFNSDGTIRGSGVALSGFDRAKFSLSGTTLTITTVS